MNYNRHEAGAEADKANNRQSHHKEQCDLIGKQESSLVFEVSQHLVQKK